MDVRRVAVRRIAMFAVCSVLLIGGCSSDGETPDGAAPASVTSVSTSTESAAPTKTIEVGPNEATLRTRLEAFYDLGRQKAYGEMYLYLSPRCQATIAEDDYVAALEVDLADRDLSGEPEFLVSVDGQVGTVVIKSADNKSEMQPKTWTYADGEWQFDNC